MIYLLFQPFIAVLVLVTVAINLLGTAEAKPFDESLSADIYGTNSDNDEFNPNQPRSLFKLRKVKKLLFG